MFSLLSESYTLLSDPTRRATYDRDVLRLHQSISSSSGAHPRGSYSSTQAGGRSPSGLSRRRTTFRGPPPSFYRSGGWGTQSEKRQRAHDESTGGSGANTSSTHSQDHSPFYRDSEGAGKRDRHAGMGPGSDPFSHAFARDAPHFDTGSHKRTQEREDVRRSSRRRKRAVGDDDVEFEPQTSLVGHFLIVSGILAVTFLAPFLYLQTVGKKRRKRDSLG
ncbi:hypothetical protein LIA77_09440 [Sarocladium implicatum]|nr:hypothetical protein LIA77_09440 [Sarocladium implicatum]